MADSRVPNPLVDQFRRGGVPRELRLMAAQGALPLGPVDLLDLLQHLLTDPEPEIAATAEQSMQGVPAEELLPIAKDRSTPPDLLGWIISKRTEKDVVESALQNTSTSDEAIEACAPRYAAELAEIVVINQVRLLRRTSLLVALESNPNLNRDQQRRLRELRETFKIGVEPEAPAPPPAPPPPPEPPPEAHEPTADVPLEAPAMSEEEAIGHYLAPDEQQDAEKVSVVQEIYRMNTAQKIIKALKGNRDARTILVRDPNRLVSAAVLGSPRLTEAEIESFAGMKNISDVILRAIGTNREWTKKYSVVSSLVRNPRTPVGIAMMHVSRLNPRDLKGIAVDRNVPEVIRKHAQKFVKQQPGQKEGR
jgi:hypothetical protein